MTVLTPEQRKTLAYQIACRVSDDMDLDVLLDYARDQIEQSYLGYSESELLEVANELGLAWQDALAKAGL